MKKKRFSRAIDVMSGMEYDIYYTGLIYRVLDPLQRGPESIWGVFNLILCNTDIYKLKNINNS